MAEADSGATPAGRVAIITGAAAGIGRGFAERLAARGIEVVIADRQADLAEEVAQAIREGGVCASVAELDVRDLRRFETLARETSIRQDHLPVSGEQSAERFERLRPMDPQRFAEKVLRAVFRNQAIIVMPRWWQLFWYLQRLSPGLGLRLSEGFLELTRRDLRQIQPR